MIVLVVKLEVQEGKKEEFIEIAKLMVEGSQQEAGNIEYNLYEELNERNTVAFIEKWKDQEALDFHEKQEHFIKNIGKLKALCSKPPVRNKFDVAK
jgi:quinol monooxygenase YgiN